MKRIILYIVTVLISFSGHAQPPEGSIAPDFTFTDINGVSRHLYGLLDSGKYVALDISATWCHPCWQYHSTGIFDSLYTTHDVPGDNTWRVFFIEGDGNTTMADLQGTGTSTQGDWLAGSTYPVIDPAPGATLNDFLLAYNINFFPTLLIICPDRKVYQDTLNKVPRPIVPTWEYMTNMCSSTGIQDALLPTHFSVSPNPAKDIVSLHFPVAAATGMQLSVSDITGRIVDTRQYSDLIPGEHSFTYDVSHLAPGLYYFALYNGNNCERQKVVVQ